MEYMDQSLQRGREEIACRLTKSDMVETALPTWPYKKTLSEIFAQAQYQLRADILHTQHRMERSRNPVMRSRWQGHCKCGEYETAYHVSVRCTLHREFRTEAAESLVDRVPNLSTNYAVTQLLGQRACTDGILWPH